MAFCLLLATPAFAADADPCMPGNGTGEARGGGLPGTVLSADFDGDGTEDRACARLAELDAEGPVNIDVEFGPFDPSGQPASVATLQEFRNPADFGDKTLSIEVPGARESLCLRGFGDGCRYGDEARVYASHPSVAVGTESGAWIFVYTGRDPADQSLRRFRTFWLSD